MNAWQETDYDSIWTPFKERFQFSPSTTEWPGFCEPLDSITYHIGHVYGTPSRYEQLTLDLSCKLIAAFQKCVPADELMCALAWPGQTYQFNPHAPFDFHNEDLWPLPALPNGDYYIFVHPSLEFGVLGHPWEQTMCVFGQPLLEAFKQGQPDLFSSAVRIGGVPNRGKPREKPRRKPRWKFW